MLEALLHVHGKFLVIGDPCRHLNHRSLLLMWTDDFVVLQIIRQR